MVINTNVSPKSSERPVYCVWGIQSGHIIAVSVFVVSVTTSCNDCGDLSAALEWTAWAPCADETSDEWTDEWTSEETGAGDRCRRRGNTYMGYEEEGRCQTHLRRKNRFKLSFLQRLFVRLHGHSSQQVVTGDQWVQKLF